jgi:hypothetical protein
MSIVISFWILNATDYAPLCACESILKIKKLFMKNFLVSQVLDKVQEGGTLKNY